MKLCFPTNVSCTLNWIYMFSYPLIDPIWVRTSQMVVYKIKHTNKNHLCLHVSHVHH